MENSVKLLKKEEHDRSRQLWERVFEEDTEAFVEYYYRYMANHNHIYGIEKEGEIVSMLHANPYTIHICNQVYPIRYIVGVATESRFRKQGMMGELLRRCLRDSYQAKEPVTYLMPAAEAIYTPYDFVSVTEQIYYECLNDYRVDGKTFQNASEEDCIELAAFSNRMLGKKYKIFTKRTPEYFNQLIKEQACQNGSVVLVKEEHELVGYFMTASEEYLQVREPIFMHETPLELKVKTNTSMMVRITHMETFLEGMQIGKGESIEVQVVDSVIHENTGTFCVSNRDGRTVCKKMTDIVDRDKAYEISELTRLVYEKYNILLNEIV